MLGLMEKILESKNIPMGFELCFNDNCQHRENCLHYQARLVQTIKRLGGPAVYPTAWESGECQLFCDNKLVQKAWGFKGIYKNVPHHQQAEARRCVKNYFSSGNGPYYRYHHGENKLSPSQQQDILNILAKFGPTDGIVFDHYETDFNFT